MSKSTHCLRIFRRFCTTASVAIAALFALQLPGVASAQVPACANRGELDELYCDANRDLVADAPKVSVNPSKLVLGISSVEDASTSRKTYNGLMDHLSVCLKKDIEMYPPTREGAVMDAQRTGLVHIGQYATGNILYAVNFAGAVPFAAKGREPAGKPDSYTLRLLVRADSTAKQPADLKGKKVAHTSLTSNSGNLAPRALLPDLGLKPDVDYKPEYSGGHDKSIMGVKLGLYDGAAVASDVMERLIAKGDIKANDFSVIFESQPFPPDAFAMSSNLDPKLQAQIKKCFIDYKFPEAMSRQLEGNNRFYPVDYKTDWEVIRVIAKASGNSPNKAGYQKLLAKK
jgi:phosphonate transport system substrate-binding protein